MKKSPETRASPPDRASPPLARDKGKYLRSYQRTYARVVGSKFVNELEGMGMSISEMAGSVQKTIFQLAKVVSYY